MERPRALGLVAGALLVSGAVVNAGQEPALESPALRRVAMLIARANLRGASAADRGTAAVRVIGIAWHADDTPVAYPVLRIRSLEDGQVEATTTGTVLGEFRFDTLDGGSYLIELLDTDGRVLAVGQMLVVLPGETVGTFIRLSDSAVSNAPLFGGGSAPIVVQTASDARVAALGGGYAASNER